MNIEVYEQYYRVNHPDGFVEIVRRNSKCTSGYMSVEHMIRLDEIKATLEHKDGNI